ncbi:MAG TPA: archaeosortase/exosortase family protein [Myxococcota bacterium]|jgi:archaeosortase B (VPXXXP-CTERM-specific)
MGLRAAASNPAYRFVGLFALYLLIFSLGYPWVTKRWIGAVEWATTGTAVIEHALLSLVSDDASIKGNLVELGPFSVLIIEECTGIFEALIFLAAVLAYPTGWVDKLIGIGLGVPILYLFNVLRILVLLWFGCFYPQHFEFMHIYFWQATLILMITSVWLLWIFKVVRHGESPAPAGT